MGYDKKLSDHVGGERERDTGQRSVPVGGPGTKRGTTGPRTLEGKRRSSFNSLNHRIFAKGVVDGRESIADYHRLQKNLLEDHQPQTHTGSLLVCKLAHEFWRLSRFYEFEGAELGKEDELGQSAGQGLSRSVARILLASDFPLNGGLMGLRTYPAIADICVELLTALRQKIEVRGLDHADMEILTRLYGRPRTHQECPNTNLAYLYYAALICLSASETEKQQKGYASEQACRTMVLNGIDSELSSLRQPDGKPDRCEEKGKPHLNGTRLIAHSGRLELLMKYKAGIEASIEKTIKHIVVLRQLGAL